MLGSLMMLASGSCASSPSSASASATCWSVVEAVGELGEDPPGQRDVARPRSRFRRRRRRPQDRQQRRRRERRGLVGEGVDDLHPAGHPTGRGLRAAQNPVFECTRLRTVGCSRPLLLERRARLGDVLRQRCGQRVAERLLDERAHDLHVLGVGRQRVGGHHPAALGGELRRRRRTRRSRARRSSWNATSGSCSASSLADQLEVADRRRSRSASARALACIVSMM